MPQWSNVKVAKSTFRIVCPAAKQVVFEDGDDADVLEGSNDMRVLGAISRPSAPTRWATRVALRPKLGVLRDHITP